MDGPLWITDPVNLYAELDTSIKNYLLNENLDLSLSACATVHIFLVHPAVSSQRFLQPFAHLTASRVTFMGSLCDERRFLSVPQRFRWIPKIPPMHHINTLSTEKPFVHTRNHNQTNAHADRVDGSFEVLY